MTDLINEFFSRFGISLWVITIPVILIAALIANFVTHRVLSRILARAMRIKPSGTSAIHRTIIALASRLANIVPAMIIIAGLRVLSEIPEELRTLIVNLCSAFIIIAIARAATAGVDLIDVTYARRPDARNKPIKGYLQLLKLVIGGVAIVLGIAALIDRNPLILLSGLGAMAAVLMLVFQDTILSLVASVQLGSNDMVRLGDWIEMPSHNADGDVTEIALHTVKVQNWDKTITTLPVRSLITESFKNWRGMTESGGRRIMRSIHLDQRSIRFLDEEEIKNLTQFVLIDEYLHEKQQELIEWNAKLEGKGADPVNSRRITNIGTFRAYVYQYLRSLSTINQDMTMLVRQLQPTSTGLPLQIYCFTSDVRWAVYENTQADIFDHLLAILPEFDLRVFQECSDLSGKAMPRESIKL